MVLFPGDEEMIHHDQPMDLEASRHGTALRTYQVVCGDFNSNLAMDTHLSNLLADHGLFLDWKYDHECIGYWVWNHVLVDHIFFIMGFPFKRYHGEKKTADFGAQMFDFDSFRLSRAKVSHANQRPMPWGPGASWGCADDVRLRSPPLSVNNQVRIVKWGSIGIIRMIDDIHP